MHLFCYGFNWQFSFHVVVVVVVDVGHLMEVATVLETRRDIGLVTSRLVIV